MEIRETTIPGCFEILPHRFSDERGYFVKTLHRDIFIQHGLETEYAEEYYSWSHHGVLRGLHFQLPPSDHVKLVYCVVGEVMDVVVDLRVGSPCYGKFALFDLSAARGNMIYIPRGLAHGFYVNGEHALMMYKVTSTYAAELDTGILWSSVGIPWPDTTPVISPRDGGFLPLAAFDSPFNFNNA
jgi:dTDP-4-dehydrorhamnose 3,5-epimerase